MKNKPILIVAGEPFGIFLEIFFKSLRKKYKSPIVIICCKKNLISQMNKCKFKKKIRLIDKEKITKINLDNNKINLINIEFKNTNNQKSRINYIEKCFDTGIKLIKDGYTYKFLNGPINKKKFLKKSHLGITEYISKKFKKKNVGMLIYNKELSVCPLTTHLPLKKVSKKIKKELIIEKIKVINSFYKDNLKIQPKIAITGLNPHCESVDEYNEDEEIVLPAVKLSKKKNINIMGPFPADTIFLKKNRTKFDVILGMYHDQVLAPIKTLFEYNAINITMGLPFLRVTPDHGPNEKMFGKNISDPQSLILALNFLDNK